MTMTEPAQMPFRQDHPLGASAELRGLRSGGPIHEVLTPVGDPAWLVTGYQAVRGLMDDERLGRSHRTPQTAPRSRASVLFGGPMGDFDAEPAGHARMRALLQPHFSPRHLRALEPQVEALARGLLDDLERSERPADLHAKVALPLPVLVICELLGVPYGDRGRFRIWLDRAAFATDAEESGRGLGDLVTYGMGLVEAKRADPGDDVISRLCGEPDLTDVEIAALTMGLLFAGYETTVVQIWLQAVQLLSDRRLWQALLCDPSSIPRAIEELLRASTVGGVGIPRYARDDIDVDGVTVRAGELVLLDPGSANHDPSVFADPDAVDFDRRPNQHVSFGFGYRYCLGAPLARMELKAVWSQLIPRFPRMTLSVEPGALRIDSNALESGLVELPVLW